MTATYQNHSSRRALLSGALAASAGVLLSGADKKLAQADQPGTDTVKSILDTALLLERVTVTFYYTALTSPAVLHTSILGGLSSDPNNPGLPPNGDPHHVRFLQAALDAEVKHAALLAGVGATSARTRFYFPAPTFTRIGSTVAADSFLGLVERLEAISIGTYIAATSQFLRLGRPDLATLATRIMGVEAEHRTLGRILAGILPPNNLTLENASFTSVGDVTALLRPFLTGRRYLFAANTTKATALPTRAQTARVVGKYGSRRLKRFL